MRKILFMTMFLISGMCSSQGNFYMWHENAVTGVLPTVVTSPVIATSIMTIATGGGEVLSDGGANVTSRGIVYTSTADGSPTIAEGASYTSDGTGTGSFASSLTSLTCNIRYYVRAYATNSVGTAYGITVTYYNWPAYQFFTKISDFNNCTGNGVYDITNITTMNQACEDVKTHCQIMLSEAPYGGMYVSKTFEVGQQLYSNYSTCIQSDFIAVTSSFYSVAKRSISGGGYDKVQVTNGIITSITFCE